jgi:hypothetical protein
VAEIDTSKCKVRLQLDKETASKLQVGKEYQLVMAGGEYPKLVTILN